MRIDPWGAIHTLHFFFTQFDNMSSFSCSQILAMASDASKLNTDTIHSACLNGELEGNGMEFPPELWTVYLISSLIKGDTCGAQLIIQRMPETGITPDFESVVNIGVHMSAQDISAALLSLGSATFNDSLLPMLDTLSKTLRFKHCITIGSAYNCISLEKLSSELVLPMEQLREECGALNWTIDESSGFVYPTVIASSIEESIDQSGQKSLETIHRLGGIVANFERKVPKISVTKTAAEKAKGGK